MTATNNPYQHFRRLRNFRSVTAISAVALALMMSSCSMSDSPTSGEAATGTEAGGTAAQMVACLKGKGVQARLSDGSGLVLVYADTGLAFESSGDSAVVTTSSSDDDSSAPGPILVEDIDTETGRAWAAFDSSQGLSKDPELQATYAECESAIPTFTQPEFSPEDDPRLKEYLAQAQADALEFAKCAREAGYRWVNDPDSDGGNGLSGGTILIPEGVTTDEVKGAVDACFRESYHFGWSSNSDIDLASIMNSLPASTAVDGE